MNYRIVIAKGDFRFEAEGDKKFVLQMLAQYGNIEQPWINADAKAVQQPSIKKAAVIDLADAASKKTSVGEFIRQLGVKKHMDLVVAFGYYLEKISGLSAFTAADVNNCYYEAKLESSNTSQMIIQNIKKGNMMPAKGASKKEDKGRQAFVLTRTGEEYVTKFTAKNPSRKN
jgi:hypothetical protein